MRCLAKVFSVLVATSALAQDGVQPTPTDQTPPQERSLDDLLGIGEDDTSAAAREASRNQRESLKRALTPGETQDTIAAAIAAMHRSATLLSEKESGTAVQRLQEDALARIDALIASAQQQQQPQPSPSSSSAGGKPEESGGKSKSKGDPSASNEAEKRRQANKRAEQGKKDGNRPGDQAGASGDRDGEIPPNQETVEGGVLQETDAEWGHLPPRMREILRQGVREKMSSLYKRSTEAYYRRIAKEAKK